MIRTQIYLPEELLLEAKLQSQSSGINLSEFIRQAIKSYSAKKITTQNRFKKLRTIKPSKPVFKNVKPEQLGKEIDKIVYDQ